MKRRYKINGGGDGALVVFRITTRLKRMFVVPEINANDFKYEIYPDYNRKELKLRFIYKPKNGGEK